VKVRAKFEGREKVMARLRAIAPAAETELATAQLEAAQDLAGKIRGRAPRRTGRYAASILGDKLSSRRSGSIIGGGLKGSTKGKNATGVFGEFIWRFLEFGTVKMARHPHIFPTYRAARKGIRRKMATAVNRALRKTKNK
jgi:HK97 gp10 family phage protein